MRVMFCVYPFPGHLFPIVPTAWAARSAGHEVLLASVSGITGVGDTLARTGLPSVDVAEPAAVEAVYEAHLTRLRAGLGPGDNPVTGVLAGWSEVMADGTVEAARRWRPDLIVHEAAQGAGPVAAAALGIPAVQHLCGFSPSAGGVAEALRSSLGEVYRRLGVAAVPPASGIDVVPPSMTRVPEMLHVRYVPYGAGGGVPIELLERPARPRIAITLGTTTPKFLGTEPLRGVLDAAARLDADLMVALGGLDPDLLGPLPPNVRTVGWLPLHTLLAGCTALVHQGGVGTTLSALAMGVPQLIMPTDFDHFINADAVVERGLGLRAAVDEVNADRLTALAEDPALAKAAAEVRNEIEAQPAPVDVITRLAGSAR